MAIDRKAAVDYAKKFWNRVADDDKVARVVVGGPHTGQVDVFYVQAELDLLQLNAQVGRKLGVALVEILDR